MIQVVLSAGLIGSGQVITQNLTDRLQSYSHTISATGGFDSADLEIAASRLEIEEALYAYLGAHVTAYNPAAVTIWEGFVDEIEALIGSVKVKLGPLSDIANRVIAIYSDSDTSDQAVTLEANDTTSQARYGIWYRTVSAGQCDSTAADNIRDTFLADNAWPVRNVEPNTGAPLGLRLRCRGYNALLAYPYTKVGTTWTLPEKLIDILENEPNGIFSTDYSHIEENAMLVPQEETQYRSGDAIVKSLVALGGATDTNRRIWGVYADRVFYYETIPNTVTYYASVTEEVLELRTASGATVAPWDVRPGRWLQFTDLLIGAPQSDDLYRDMRAMFIESVTFSLPYRLQLRSGKTTTLPQLLARTQMLRSL